MFLIKAYPPKCMIGLEIHTLNRFIQPIEKQAYKVTIDFPTYYEK